MPLVEILCLIAAAAAAGMINAIAGGGTLITFPVLLFFNTPAVQANATSTVALVIGTAGSILGFREHIAAVKPWLSRFIPVSILGGWIGSVMLTRTSNQTFAHLVPFLILFAFEHVKIILPGHVQNGIGCFLAIARATEGG